MQCDNCGQQFTRKDNLKRHQDKRCRATLDHGIGRTNTKEKESVSNRDGI